MRVYIMTDLEGVCGILNFEDWCRPESRYYEQAKELLTQEVNAAIEGFISAGLHEFVVADGHGCGAIAPASLHPAAELMRGWPTSWPFLLDETGCDAVAWVGQHPKAGTARGHLCHTQSFAYRDESINAVSVGEFGQFAMCASELGVRSIFGSGCEAFGAEARALVAGIETVAVKRGTQPDPGHALPEEAYRRHNYGAIHLSPEEARIRIRAGARRAAERARSEKFGLIPLQAPFRRVTVYRSTATEPARVMRTEHPASVAGVLRARGAATPLQADPMSLL